MRRLVIDTNLYVDWVNEGLHEAVIFQRDAVKHLSAVVMMELAAGAFSLRDRRHVQEIVSSFRKANRIIAPSAALYEEAGDVLRRLQNSFDYTLSSAYGLANDVLIALSARSIGAVVITQNEQDFVAIQRIQAFELVIVAD
jgi:predicted nucleic acid-binding protein